MTALTITKEQLLQQYGKDVLGHLKRGAEATFLAGETLFKVRGLCEYGEWLDWCKMYFPLHERTAQRYIALYKRFSDQYKELAVVALDILDDGISTFELTAVAAQTKDQKDLIQHSATIVHELAPENLKHRIAAGEVGLVNAARAITFAPDSVRNCAKKWNVNDPSVIHTLTQTSLKLPDEFEAIERSGQMMWANGYSVKLDRISGIEARECYVSLRKEAGIIEHQAGSPQPIIETTAMIGSLTISDSEHDLYNLNLVVDSQTYRTLQKHINTQQKLIIKPLTR